MTSKIEIDINLCSGCQTCIALCPRDCFILNDEKKAVFSSNGCHNCGHCISACPEKAISHTFYPLSEYLPISEHLDAKFLNGEQIYFLLKSIRSVRCYLKKPIEQEIINKLVDIVRYSPTGHHSQNVEITIVTNSNIINQLKDECGRTIKSFFKKINNPLKMFFAKIFGKSASIKKLHEAKPRLIRMLNGFETGKENLFHGAPLIMVFHANTKSITPEDNCNQAASYVRLLSHGYNLGSCFIGYLTQFAKYNKQILRILRLPKSNKIYQTLIIGYPKYKFNTFVARKEAKKQIL
ncbi:MAG: nitroreductase family protein [Candidatus Heimdallarchaeota archaeon]|nr:nitroreductase family protein [Candidatus Heimdallarchaeota archaeon]